MRTAIIEAELIDALTGEVVVAVIDLQKGRVYNKLTKYGLVKEVIERWSKPLITRMGEAHRKNPWFKWMLSMIKNIYPGNNVNETT